MCSAGVNLYWHPPIRDGSELSNLSNVFNALIGSVLGCALREVSIAFVPPLIGYLRARTRAFAVAGTEGELFLGRDAVFGGGGGIPATRELMGEDTR